MVYTEKIDFHGGAHGHFLELIINLFIHRIDVEGEDFFTDTGACHLMNRNTSYHPIIKCNHYSYLDIPFSSEDKVIEIHCTENDMLIAVTNSLLRGGNQTIIIDSLDQDTVKKLEKVPKARFMLETLIAEYGESPSYPRSVLRNYFYSMFDMPEYGINRYNNFKCQGSRLAFPFSSFFNLEQFFVALNRCAFFLNMDFCPTDRIIKLWEEFIKLNQGWQSQLRVNQAIYSILTRSSTDISNFNIIEEAWLLHQIAKIFRCYAHPLLTADQFPLNTKDIATIVYNWKKDNC